MSNHFLEVPAVYGAKSNFIVLGSLAQIFGDPQWGLLVSVAGLTAPSLTLMTHLKRSTSKESPYLVSPSKTDGTKTGATLVASSLSFGGFLKGPPEESSTLATPISTIDGLQNEPPLVEATEVTPPAFLRFLQRGHEQNPLLKEPSSTNPRFQSEQPYPPGCKNKKQKD